MKRYFEKISKEQFDKDFSNYDCSYDDIIIPKRSTVKSMGYDFYLPIDIEIKSNQVVKIPTGIKVSMYDDEFLGIYDRSGTGFKYNIRMCNQVGLIDADYYNNIDNEGHIWLALQNHSGKDYSFKKGDKLVQGVFQKYLVVENEEEVNGVRKGGLGSTDKGDDKDE